MKKLIRRILKEDLEYWRVSDASPNSDEYEMGVLEDFSTHKDYDLDKGMDIMKHHEELEKEHIKLLKQLELAKQFMEKKKKHWKSNRKNDKARFDYQKSIGLVRQIEKKLWQFD